MWSLRPSPVSEPTSFTVICGLIHVHNLVHERAICRNPENRQAYLHYKHTACQNAVSIKKWVVYSSKDVTRLSVTLLRIVEVFSVLCKIVYREVMTHCCIMSIIR